MAKRQLLRMKWRSREAAEELVREFEASGMRRKQFCAYRSPPSLVNTSNP